MKQGRTLIGFAVAVATLAAPAAAWACGCFAPPSPAEPVVQAGERIAFGVKDGRVTAHIQIQYQGSASDFAWLVPVPTVPDVRVGTEQLFTRLQQTTGPQLLLNPTGGFCGGEGGGCAFGPSASFDNNAPPEDPGAAPGPEPVVVAQASAGPYDYAVVRADDKQPMLEWLNDNRYFVPSNLAALIDPYVRPGAYFLALRLSADAEVGDIRPIVLDYEADYPTIPITLTQMGAIDDMGVLVWILGASRAIPHNYQHVVLNEAYVHRPSGAVGYHGVVSRAVDEAADGHAFVTEYAGRAGVVGPFWVPAAGSRAILESQVELRGLAQQVRAIGLDVSPDARRVLATAYPPIDIPELSSIVDGQYEAAIVGLLEDHAEAYSDAYGFDADALTEALWTDAVEPMQEAAALVRDQPYLTRMYTTLDPEEMTVDPAFAFNPSLPPVERRHTANLQTVCDDDDYPTRLHLDDGRSYRIDNRLRIDVEAPMPYAAQVQVLRQEGPPEVVVDNRAALMDGAGLEAGGCRSGGGSRSRAATLFVMCGLVWAGGRLSRRGRAKE